MLSICLVVGIFCALFSGTSHIVFSILGDSPGSELYVPTFRNHLFHFYKSCEQ